MSNQQLSCPKCGTDTLRGSFATWQIIVSIIFFPVGLLSLAAGRKPNECPKCGYKWESAVF